MPDSEILLRGYRARPAERAPPRRLSLCPYATMSGPRSLSSLAKVRIDEMQYCDVDGKDLPLKMPIAKYSELTELPPSLSSRLLSSSAPQLPNL